MNGVRMIFAAFLVKLTALAIIDAIISADVLKIDDLNSFRIELDNDEDLMEGICRAAIYSPFSSFLSQQPRNANEAASKLQPKISMRMIRILF
jgi:hypothetical protein